MTTLMKCSNLIQLAAKIIQDFGDIPCVFGALPHRPFHSANVSLGTDPDGKPTNVAIFCSAEDVEVIANIQKSQAAAKARAFGLVPKTLDAQVLDENTPQ